LFDHKRICSAFTVVCLVALRCNNEHVYLKQVFDRVCFVSLQTWLQSLITQLHILLGSKRSTSRVIQVCVNFIIHFIVSQNTMDMQKVPVFF